MKVIKKIFSSLYLVSLILLIIGITVFRIADVYYDFEISGKLVDPLFEKYPVIMFVLAGFALLYFLIRIDDIFNYKNKDNHEDEIDS